MKIPRFDIKVSDEIISQLSKSLSNGQLSTGPFIDLFKKELKKKLKSKYLTLTSNGFSAIFILLKALKRLYPDIKYNKIALPIVSTCFATVNAVISSGFQPIFYQLDKDALSGDLKNIESLIYENKDTFAIIIIDHFGIRNKITKQLQDKYNNIFIINDYAQSILNQIYYPRENNEYYETYSFYPTKGLNAIDGGAIATHNSELNEIINDIVSYNHQKINDGWERYNFKLSNINAQLGFLNMENANANISKRIDIQVLYDRLFSHYNLKTYSESNIMSKYVIYSSKSHAILNKLQEKKIAASCEFIDIANENNILVKNIISFPFHENLKFEELEYMMITIKEVLNEV